MLRINLLPVRQLQKRAQAKQQISLLIAMLCLVVAILFFVNMSQKSTISDLNNAISSLKRQEKQYAPTLARIEKMKKDNAELERKADIIDKLQTDSSLTVRVMDEVAKSVDNTRMWLNSLEQQGGSLQLSGIALDNRTISEFMNVLKESPYINTVDLTDTSMQTVSGRKLKKFSLRCAVSSPTKNVEEKQAPQKKS